MALAAVDGTAVNTLDAAKDAVADPDAGVRFHFQHAAAAGGPGTPGNALTDKQSAMEAVRTHRAVCDVHPIPGSKDTDIVAASTQQQPDIASVLRTRIRAPFPPHRPIANKRAASSRIWHVRKR
eukprot:gene13272-biopygen5700